MTDKILKKERYLKNESFPEKIIFSLLCTSLNKIKLNQEYKRQPIFIDPASSILPSLMAIDSSNLVKSD